MGLKWGIRIWRDTGEQKKRRGEENEYTPQHAFALKPMVSVMPWRTTVRPQRPEHWVWSCFISSLCYSSPVWAWALLAAPELHVPFCKTRMIKSPSCLCSYWSAAPSPACSHGSHDMAAICVFESLCVITIDLSRRFELIGTAATWKTALKNCQGSLYLLYW